MSDPKAILAIEMQENDAKAKTVRDYLIALLRRLWEDEETFNGKRPFGNSNWNYELYRALVLAKAVRGNIDEYGDITNFDERAAEVAIFDAIDALS